MLRKVFITLAALAGLLGGLALDVNWQAGDTYYGIGGKTFRGWSLVDSVKVIKPACAFVLDGGGPCLTASGNHGVITVCSSGCTFPLGTASITVPAGVTSWLQVVTISGASGSQDSSSGWGSCAGGYAETDNVTVTPLSVIPISIPSGGGVGSTSNNPTAGSDASYNSGQVIAKGAPIPNSSTGCPTPSTTGYAGTIKFPGGQGGSAPTDSAGAGGGAGGPSAAGSNGGNGGINNGSEDAGGGGGGGANGQGAGGNGGNASTTPGVGGTAGGSTGGVGGSGDDTVTTGSGETAGTAFVIAAGLGPYGGSGAPGGSVNRQRNGVAGGKCGGGASGGAFNNGGAGGQGLGANGGGPCLILVY